MGVRREAIVGTRDRAFPKLTCCGFAKAGFFGANGCGFSALDARGMEGRGACGISPSEPASERRGFWREALGIWRMAWILRRDHTIRTLSPEFGFPSRALDGVWLASPRRSSSSSRA